MTDRHNKSTNQHCIRSISWVRKHTNLAVDGLSLSTVHCFVYIHHEREPVCIVALHKNIAYITSAADKEDALDTLYRHLLENPFPSLLVRHQQSFDVHTMIATYQIPNEFFVTGHDGFPLLGVMSVPRIENVIRVERVGARSWKMRDWRWYIPFPEYFECGWA